MNKRFTIKIAALIIIGIAIIAGFWYSGMSGNKPDKEKDAVAISEEASTSAVDTVGSEETSTVDVNEQAKNNPDVEADTTEDNDSSVQVGDEFVIELEKHQESGEID